jgi:GxxExxY protein
MPFDDESPPYFEPDEELDRLAHALIGAAIEVHRRMGPGLDEESYESAMAIEFKLRSIPFARQVPIDICYKGEKVGIRRIDFIVGGRLLVELKAIEALAKVHYAQVRTYLKLTGLTFGLLINFNVAVLKDGIKRVICA